MQTESETIHPFVELKRSQADKPWVQAKRLRKLEGQRYKICPKERGGGLRLWLRVYVSD